MQEKISWRKIMLKSSKKQFVVLLVALVTLLIIACDDSSGSSKTILNNVSYPLVKTNQTSFYNTDSEITAPESSEAFYGQDAQYQAGATISYTDNGDGTVSDNSTGLMWQQIPRTESFTYDDAVAYCDTLVINGYDDWRMPSLKELFSISDFSAGWPYIDTTYFKLSFDEITKDEQYWSSNRYVGVTVEGQGNAAFGVNHVTGHIKAYSATDELPDGPAPDGKRMPRGNAPAPKSNARPNGVKDDGPGGPDGPGEGFNPLAKQVRAVRGNTYGLNDFVDNGDSTITDNATGLMWTQLDSEEGMDWETALSYAENSEYADYTDWRLPNVKELQSIVDYSYAPGAADATLDRAAIDPIFECSPIINEAGVDDFAYYWTSTSASFTLGQPYYYAWYVAFGRAVNDAGLDFHGAGAVRFDTKVEDGPNAEGGERYYNYVRLVRNVD
jgi:hypothetical protein